VLELIVGSEWGKQLSRRTQASQGWERGEDDRLTEAGNPADLLGIRDDGQDLHPGTATTTCACLVLINCKGDRSFFYHGGANELFSPQDVDESLAAEAAIVHVGGTYLLPRLDGEGAAGLFERAQAAGKLTSMDVTWDVSPDRIALLHELGLAQVSAR
jgi:sugar/nucleoside kinase (ribokinase family)